MSTRLFAVVVAAFAALVGGCGDNGPPLLPSSENVALSEAFVALKVTTWRTGQGSPLRYGCSAVRKDITPERRRAVATIIRIAGAFPEAWSENVDAAGVPPEPVRKRVSQRAQIVAECLTRVGVAGHGWARAATDMERAAG
jgi:predicted small lipoprotein YifL